MMMAPKSPSKSNKKWEVDDVYQTTSGSDDDEDDKNDNHRRKRSRYVNTFCKSLNNCFFFQIT